MEKKGQKGGFDPYGIGAVDPRTLKAGTTVFYYPIAPAPGGQPAVVEETITHCEPWQLGDGTWVVAVADWPDRRVLVLAVKGGLMRALAEQYLDAPTELLGGIPPANTPGGIRWGLWCWTGTVRHDGNGDLYCDPASGGWGRPDPRLAGALLRGYHGKDLPPGWEVV